MPARLRAPRAAPTAGAQLNTFIGRFAPEIAREMRRSLALLRRRLPGATEIIYDNYRGLVVGFGPGERASLAVLSLFCLPDHVTLCFLQAGRTLPDPHGKLRGNGNVVRHIRLESAATLEGPEVQALIGDALARAKVPIECRGRRRIVIKAVAKKQLPRRPAR